MTGAKEYVPRPVTIEAMQLLADEDYTAGELAVNEIDILEWFQENAEDSGCELHAKREGHRLKFSIVTLEGTMELHPGSWLIRGTEGEFYPCKDSVFRQKYIPKEHSANGKQV